MTSSNYEAVCRTTAPQNTVTCVGCFEYLRKQYSRIVEGGRLFQTRLDTSSTPSAHHGSGSRTVGLRQGMIDKRSGLREPDLVFELDGPRIGIEVACAYCDEREAHVSLDIALHKITAEQTAARSMRDPNLALVKQLNRTFTKHCAKVPYSLSTWLVLDAFGTHAPITSDIDASEILAGLSTPDPCPFAAIFLCLSGHTDNQPKFFAVLRCGV
jgi:hypothetical protein